MTREQGTDKDNVTRGSMSAEQKKRRVVLKRVNMGGEFRLELGQQQHAKRWSANIKNASACITLGVVQPPSFFCGMSQSCDSCPAQMRLLSQSLGSNSPRMHTNGCIFIPILVI